MSIRAENIHNSQLEAMADKITGKLALVTGSTSGIGLGIARKFASEGYNIILTGFAEQEFVTFLKNDFRQKYNTDALYLSCDLTNPANIERMYEQIMEFSPRGVDVLVNCAGIQHVSPVDKFPPAKWDEMVAVMLSAPFHLIRLLVPHMAMNGFGRIVNIISVHGQISTAGKAPYSAVKHGLIGLSKGVALDMVGTGVTCNSLCPGYVETPLALKQIEAISNERGLSFDDAKIALMERQPLKDFVSVEDVAELVLYLTKDAAKSVTGAVWGIDNGYLAK